MSKPCQYTNSKFSRFRHLQLRVDRSTHASYSDIKVWMLSKDSVMWPAIPPILYGCHEQVRFYSGGQCRNKLHVIQIELRHGLCVSLTTFSLLCTISMGAWEKRKTTIFKIQKKRLGVATSLFPQVMSERLLVYIIKHMMIQSWPVGRSVVFRNLFWSRRYASIVSLWATNWKCKRAKFVSTVISRSDMLQSVNLWQSSMTD